MPPLTLRPIGVARTPFQDKVSAPRQPYASDGAAGTIELLPEYEHALCDLEGFDYIWVVFWFHLNAGFRSKVLPPRSSKRRGVFSTRSPHRPNPIGLSLVKLDEVSGLVVRVHDIDLVDGTPVLDLKPYVPYADARPNARAGWLEAEREALDEAPVTDPIPEYAVAFAPLALEQTAWLRDRGIDLEKPVSRVLELGPQPHPYRRIKKVAFEGAPRSGGEARDLQLAVKDWRVRFLAVGRTITVIEVFSGYREKELATSEAEEVRVHRDFATRFRRGQRV